MRGTGFPCFITLDNCISMIVSLCQVQVLKFFFHMVVIYILTNHIPVIAKLISSSIICLNLLSQPVSFSSQMLWTDWKEFPHSDGDLDLYSQGPIFVSSPSHTADVLSRALFIVWRDNSFIMRKRSRNVVRWQVDIDDWKTRTISCSLPIPRSPEGRWAHVCRLCCHMLWWALMKRGVWTDHSE